MMSKGKIYIYNRHAIMEAAVYAPRLFEQVFILPKFADSEIKKFLDEKRIKVSVVSDFPKDVLCSRVRQGIVALIRLDQLVIPYKKFIENLIMGPNTSLVLLDELSDPQNVGAVIRSAAAFGLSGVLIPEHNQTPITESVINVSAGMAFRLPLVSVANINSVLRDLKEHGFWIYGMEGTAKDNIDTENFDVPTVFVMGNEENGIKEKTRELCDILLKIPMNPKCESLNVAASAAVTFYAWSKRHSPSLL